MGASIFAAIAVELLTLAIHFEQASAQAPAEAVAAPAAAAARSAKSADAAKPQGTNPQPANAEGAKTEPGKTEAAKPDEAKKDEASNDTVKRPQAPPRVPDPREFDVRPDKNARVRFSFNGQPWPDLLQWLATISGCSLDWQELPNDYVNVTADRDYSIPEARDLFNRLLFDRGYTLVVKGDVMSVVKIAKLDPSLLMRVEDESQLMDLPAYDFVKITFELPDKLKADQAEKDVKSMLSANAKVLPLMATNRLLVIDVVANLREVSRIINSEHAAATGKIVPREFSLRFARADQVADQVMVLLGLDPSSRRTPQEKQQEMQLEQQRLQLMQQMQQKGGDVSKYMRKADEPTIYLAVNHRSNSVVVNAPPAEMKIVERAIEMFDVPAGLIAGATHAAVTMSKYQLVTISPQSLVTALDEIGNLDPRTRLTMDADAKVVFANATAADHEKIQAMIDRLDGTGRQFEVIWLRRLPVDAVAATIRDLMVGKEKENDENRFSYYYYRSRDDDKKGQGGFRVDADVENNRLLLWANESELKEVRTFLAKLGEIPGESGNPNTVRMLDALGGEETIRLLQQLRRTWPALEQNELRIEGAPQVPKERKEEPKTEDKQPAPTADEKAPPARANENETAQAPVAFVPFVRVAQREVAGREVAQREDASTTPSEKGEPPAGQPQPPQGDAEKNSKPPVTITIHEDGRMILSSSDTQALDRLESLMSQISPHKKKYEVFYLKYALASLVTLNLEEYFQQPDSSSDSDDNYWRGWYGFRPSEKKQAETVGLGTRPKIRFIYDFDTNSILVSNATPTQLETVRALVEIYDKAPSEESISARRYKFFQLNYARADAVAKTLKEVYRDLLSTKDKEFDTPNGKNEKDQSSQPAGIYHIYGNNRDSDTDDGKKKPTKVKATFAGALSIGVDEISNTVIVSAQEEWMDSITEMIEYLDKEASTYEQTAKIITAPVDPNTLRTLISKVPRLTVGREKEVVPQFSQQPQQQQGQPQQPGQNGNQQYNNGGAQGESAR